MKKHFIRRGAALLLLAAAFTAFTGCANNNSNSSSCKPANQIYTPVVPEHKVDENLPGEEKKSAVGQSLKYQDKVTAELGTVVELDACKTQDLRFFVAEFTITNTSTAALDCSALTHFNIRLNGENNDELGNNVSALVFSRKYYTKLGSEMKILNQAIDAGQSLSGYIYFAAPVKWDSLQIVYTPYKYYNTDKLIFDVTEDGLTHYTEALG